MRSTRYTEYLMIGDTADALVQMPSPSEFSISLQDIDAATTTRTADGKMHRDRIVGAEDAKRKLNLKFPPMPWDDVSQLLKAIKNEFFWVKYPDPYTGEMRTAEFYSGDRNAGIYNFQLRSDGMLWNTTSFNLIEN